MGPARKLAQCRIEIHERISEEDGGSSIQTALRDVAPARLEGEVNDPQIRSIDDGEDTDCYPAEDTEPGRDVPRQGS